MRQWPAWDGDDDKGRPLPSGPSSAPWEDVEFECLGGAGESKQKTYTLGFARHGASINSYEFSAFTLSTIRTAFS